MPLIPPRVHGASGDRGILHLELGVVFSKEEVARRKTMADDVNRRVGELIESLLEETSRTEGMHTTLCS